MIETSLKYEIERLFPHEIAILGGRWDRIIADENKTLHAKDFSLIRVKSIQIPPNSILIPIPVLKRNEIEIIDLLMSEKPGRIDSAIIYSETKNNIKEGEILAILKISPAVPVGKNKILEVFRQLTSVKNYEIEEKFIRSYGPIW